MLGSTVNLQKELNSLTLSIILSSAFGADAQAKDTMLKSIDAVLHAVEYRTFEVPISQIPLLHKLPILKKQIMDKNVGQISAIVERLVGDRKLKKSQSLCQGDDLLDLLLMARDQDLNPFTEQQVRDEAMAFVLAGHETTGNLLVWCFYILMTHPDVYQDCKDEVARVLRGQPPDYSQLSELHVIEAVLQETLRLYPPAPTVVRECIHEHLIGPEGNQIRVPVIVIL
ncbi:unnamed protein product [Didymodactylos carnosus]|uniref:Cytochrome P450 n=1 Tax=Didymodactylos carnosus TaxID=1234261 RepID=A0A816AWV0_9BILA|nr:unnamed protein product [Didymodactylos carnosus]CAF4477806.1 unnamed protein product [Didymodactylos carnosus]